MPPRSQEFRGKPTADAYSSARGKSAVAGRIAHRRKGPLNSAAALTPGRGVSIYVRLANLFRDSITSGEWPAGHQLPVIRTLCEQYGVATVTVRKALNSLSAEGLLSITQGRGTFVKPRPPELPASRDFRHAINDPLKMAPSESIRVIGRKNVHSLPPELAFEGPTYDTYVRTKKVHFISEQPFQVVDLYVAKPVHDRFPRGAERISKTSMLLRDFGRIQIRATRQEITIAHATPEVAKLLDCPIGSVLVRIRRWRVGKDNRLVYAALNFYRGDRFVLDIHTEHLDSSNFAPGFVPATRADPSAVSGLETGNPAIRSRG